MFKQKKPQTWETSFLWWEEKLSVFVCVCVWASVRVYLFTHMLRSMGTSRRKAGMWQTGLERRETHLLLLLLPSSSLLFFITLFVCTEKREAPNKDIKQNSRAREREDRNIHGIIRVFLKNAQSTKKRAGIQQPTSCCFRAQHQSLWRWNWDSAFVSCLILSAAPSFFCPLFPLMYCRLPPPPPPFLLIFSPSPWIEHSFGTESIGLEWWPSRVVRSC